MLFGERSKQMIDKNRDLYLSVEDRSSVIRNTIYDLMNASYEDNFWREITVIRARFPALHLVRKSSVPLTSKHV